MDLGSAFKFITKYTPADPVTAAVLRSFYELSQFSSQIRAVNEQTKDLLFTTYHVASNVKEARRLRRIKATMLDASERNWTDSVIRDTEYALFEIAKLVEPARIDLKIHKSVEFHNKVDWVLKRNIKVPEKHARLTTCHQSLVAVISSLSLKTVTIEIVTIAEEYPSPHDPVMQRFLNFQNQRNRKRSIMSLQSEGSSAASSSSMSSASIMMKTPNDQNSGNLTTGIVKTSSTLAVPGLEVLNLKSSHGDNKLLTDFTPTIISSVGNSPCGLANLVPTLDGDTDQSDMKYELGTGSPIDYFAGPEHLETNFHSFMGSTPAADTEHETVNTHDDGDNNLSTTVLLPQASFPDADGLQVYRPYSPDHFPPFHTPPHTRASTSSSLHYLSISNAECQNVQSSPNSTGETEGSSTSLDHFPHSHKSQQEMHRAFSNSIHAPEFHRPSSATSLAVSEGAQRSMSAGRGGACRAQRNWLKLHASRVDNGHGIGWQDG
ncbi:MAG: hypothetical protein OHK93_002450 [Ramalina farinacea]|uniref:Uncharacterized protein n=1 Tax=Ramalina farinacea TaxID=258253 RepID=A0AA43QS86_9LECA|nr:hypothetical protein [Ramalina farinacea]